jgi:hypothetical protein
MRTSIAVVVPAPSRTVVLSLSIVTFYRRAQVLQRQVLEPDAEVVGDRSAVGEDGEVLEHRLSPVAVAGCLDGSDLQRPSQLVHDRVASASPSTSSAITSSGWLLRGFPCLSVLCSFPLDHASAIGSR